MGSCFSKKTTDNKSTSSPTPPQALVTEQTKGAEDQETLKKEFFIIREGKSQDLDRLDEKGKTEQKPIVVPSDNPKKSDPIEAHIAVGSGVLRTSSCTREEIDAILIQCGRLSRSSSNGGKTACSGSSENHASGHKRRYSGSKRSYDFDQDGSNNLKGSSFQRDDYVADDDDQTTVERIRRHRQRQSSGRRRTPSRERDQQQRSGSSRERNTNSSGTGRRVSRSPGRRSESPITGGGAIASGNITNSNAVNKPGKIVTVPATVTSLVMEKSSNLCEAPPSSSSAMKRVQPKEISVVSRTAASPRSQSPAGGNLRSAAENPNAQSGQQPQQPLSLSRSNSRKAEQSPFRRNPLGEIDQNVTTVYQKPNNPSPSPTSYTALLLEDIQNFHQKKKELPCAESEAIVKDGLLEQSIHQYVTVRRSRDEEEESSGSNSIVSTGGHNWVSADSAHSSSKDDATDARTRRMSEIKKRSGFENKQKAAPRIGRN